jgi:CheY-like chemotaxis protein
MMEPPSGAAIECLLAEDNAVEVQRVWEALPAVPVPLHLHVVDDGEQALTFLQQHGVYAAAPRPDLVFLDLSLPKRRGEDVLAVLQGDPILQTIPVFVALESVGERVVVQRQGLHPVHYLLKPLIARQLLRALRHGSMRGRVNDTLEAVRKTTARAHAAVDRTRQLLQEAEEFRQYRRAVAERQAEQGLHSQSDLLSLPISARSSGTPQPWLLSEVDFLRWADYMREELHQFFLVVRRRQANDALLHAAEQLQDALNRCEPLVSEPHQREGLPMEQRWGFLLLLSCVESAREALKQG